MSRLYFSFFVAVLMICCSIFVSAQENPLQEKTIQTTPEILALTAEIHQLLKPLPDSEKIPVLFQLLGFELRFSDKQQAQNTIRQLLTLVSTIEKESVQAQILEAVAIAQADLGDYEQSVKTPDQILKPSNRVNAQLNIAERIIENIENSDNETEKQFDVTGLLRKSLAGTIETKDAGFESLVSIILARELAKQGKTEESKILFEKARKKAREVEEIEERNLVSLMVRSLILVDQQAEALALVETINDEESKILLLSQAAFTLAQENKFTDAINLVKLIKQNEIKDNIILNLVRNNAKTITIEQILELAKQTGSPEFREQLLQDTFFVLLINKRDDILGEFIKHLGNVAENKQIFQLYQLKLLIDAKKFEEAVQFIKRFDSISKTSAIQYLFTAGIQQSNGITEEELLNLISETYSEEEKTKIALLQQEVENVLKSNHAEEQMAGLIQVFQSSREIFDLRGLRNILNLTLELTEKLGDPCKIVQIRLALTGDQMILYDKSGVKENLNRLQQYLDGIKDVRVFKKLFLDESAQPTQVSENDSLFYIYTSITSIWYDIGENEEAKKSFQKAQNIANTETDITRKIEKLFTLVSLLIEKQSD